MSCKIYTFPSSPSLGADLGGGLRKVRMAFWMRYKRNCIG